MPDVSPSWIGSPDPSRREALNRALTVSGAGNVLLQTNINRVVQMLTLREFGAQATLPRKPGSGNAAYINRRTAGTTGGEWVADTDTATEEVGSYAQVSFTYRTLLTKGQVTRKLIATGRSYGDVLAQELAGKSEDFANIFESALLIGNAGAGGNANQINGLLTLINAQSGQVVAQTTAAGGDDLTLAKLDAAIDKVKGAGSRSDLVIYASFHGARKLNATLQAQQRFVNETEIDGGFRVNTYNGIPIVISTGLPDALVWSGSSITAFSGGSTTAMVIANRRYNWIEELTPMTVMPLSRSTSQNEAFEIFWDGTFVYSNTLGGAILGGIKNS